MFEVRVADNFHYMDEKETYTSGEFSTWAEAVTAAKGIVDRCLAEYFHRGMKPEALYQQYVLFGDDPYIIPVPPGESFSAWEYALQQCKILCSNGE